MSNEVLNKRIDSIRCPSKPVLIRGFQVTYPETTEERRVHVIDIVLSTVVNSSINPCLRMELLGGPSLVIAQLTVKDQLEEGLLDAWQRAVELIKHQDDRLLARAVPYTHLTLPKPTHRQNVRRAG